MKQPFPGILALLLSTLPLSAPAQQSLLEGLENGPPKGYLCRRAATPVTVDGRLTDIEWQSAPWSDAFVDIEGDRKPLPKFETRVKMLWDDQCLYIAANLEEPHVWATLTKRDTVIFYDNDFEFFIDPNGDNHEYYEFEMNALNTGWDLFLPKPYRDGGPPINAWDIEGIKTAVHIDGTLNDPRDTDRGWSVEIAIPWNALRRFAHTAVPPREGDQWRINFSRVEWDLDVIDGAYRKVKGRPEHNWVWTPQWAIDIHRPELWGYLQFTKKPSGANDVRPDRSLPARTALMKVYHDQRARFARDSVFAFAASDLGPGVSALPAGVTDLHVFAVPSGWRAEVTVDGERWAIRQDSRIERVDEASREFILSDGLIIRSAPGFSDYIGFRDPIEGSLVAGTWRTPGKGVTIRYSDTLQSVWEPVRCDTSGWFDHRLLRGAYVFFEVEWPRDEIMLLRAMGNSIAYVNGEPRAGNPYGYKDTWEAWEPRFDYSILPVKLRKGKNELLFHCNRERFKARLTPPTAPLSLNVKDLTIPDLIEGEQLTGHGGVVVVNSTERALTDVVVSTRIGGGKTRATPRFTLQPMSVQKIPVPLVSSAETKSEAVPLFLELRSGGRRVDTASVQLRVVSRSAARKVTFVSRIDGSVQYYALLPAAGEGDKKPKALVLSLHGASVEAINQAYSYAPKTWAHIVCPTNRRPYGFNWEDWGRTDALEVLALARDRLEVDESRVYLTGHSMGGHGTFHVASLYPDQFAAIGPSAGWISFWTYRVREAFTNPTPMRQMLMRAALPSETDTFADNYRNLGVYILHGSDDDNVPVGQSRAMAQHLEKFHKDFVFHEQPGVGHWWDNSDEPGASCVDWPPMFDFFARHARPETEKIREIRFSTPNPGISSRCYWASVEAQTEQLKLSRIEARVDPGTRRFVGTTVNVRRLGIETAVLGASGPFAVELDGQTIAGIPWPKSGKIQFERRMGIWAVAAPASRWLKSPARYGTFRDAIRHNVLFVYGTSGTKEENSWAFEKARFDAERFWYQGNGSIEVQADTQCTSSVTAGRNIVLFGNSSTNRLWNELLAGAPVQVKRGSVEVGDRSFTGDDLFAVFVYPREGTADLSIGAVAGTGVTGMKATNRLTYLLPGIAFPDLLIARAGIWINGESEILCAGFFGDDWSMEQGEFVWTGP